LVTSLGLKPLKVNLMEEKYKKVQYLITSIALFN